MCHNRFKEDRENVNDDARCGRPSKSTAGENIKTTNKIFLDNRGITIKEVADDSCMSFGSPQAIFMDVLGIKRATRKVVPKLLNFEHGHIGYVDDAQRRSRFKEVKAQSSQ